MGTDSIYKVVYENKEYNFYNQYDSSPCDFGNLILKELKKANFETWKFLLKKIESVPISDFVPKEKLLQIYNPWELEEIVKKFHYELLKNENSYMGYDITYGALFYIHCRESYERAIRAGFMIHEFNDPSDTSQGVYFFEYVVNLDKGIFQVLRNYEEKRLLCEMSLSDLIHEFKCDDDDDDDHSSR